MAQSDDEDDYMNMVFEDVPKQPKYESGMQRAARLRKEGAARAFTKSKDEREADAEAAREASLATALPETNKGFKMMAKFGYKKGDTLGKSESARKEPIRVEIKGDRAGIGIESEKKRKWREQFEEARHLAKKSKVEEVDYREAQRQMQKDRQIERDLDNAQRSAEQLSEKSDNTASNDINVLWRGRARRRAQSKHEQQERREFNNSIASRDPLLPPDDEDNDSKIAQGRDLAAFYTTIETDLEEEDPELAEFEALPAIERLRRVLTYLRDKHRYCLYCGHQYPDDEMDGCPGETEEDHE